MMQMLTDSLKMNKTLKILNIRFSKHGFIFESEQSIEYLVELLKENHSIQELICSKHIPKKFLFQMEEFLDRNRREKIHFGEFSKKLNNIHFKFL
jgi:hypothetical protein